MSGHSKWATIKRKKGKSDAQRGRIFTKIGREIAVAVKAGGGDPDQNVKLRDVIAKAKANNMPNENIQRSIKKAAGEADQVNYEEILYEGYAPGGVAMLVETLTDNRNRTVSDVRHLFDKSGGSLGAQGAVMWLFDRKGVLVVEKNSQLDSDAMMLLALEAGAEDLIEEEDAYQIVTQVDQYFQVRETIESQHCTLISTGLEMIPQTTVNISDPEIIQKINLLIERLEDHDDVQNIYHNAEFPFKDEDEE